MLPGAEGGDGVDEIPIISWELQSLSKKAPSELDKLQVSV